MGVSGKGPSKAAGGNAPNRGAGKTLDALIANSGGRKWMLAVMVVISANVLAWFEKITGEWWAAAMVGTAGAYIAGNVVAQIKGKDDGS